ncbi:MAG: Ppx/GppA family phosphatase [Candidatus Methanoplasma sp.]|jgi:exopolyphosphatase/guanosine-5'-triphosphate,3'-diphosphate pyrophosphatase|nr:Ppx/GppA family phosphatase [Candidatus Methanoplasma sp.]
MKARTASFIDVGTNSIHILVARFFEGAMGTVIYQDKEAVRLGRSLYESGRIGPEAIGKAALVMSRFMDRARALGSEETVAYATCAAREAPDRRELISALNACGADVRIISGLEEARLIRLGVFGPGGPPERSLVIDIGGGSTEIALCEGGRDAYLDSLSMGSVRFAHGLGADPSAAMSHSEYDLLRRSVDLLSYRTRRMVRDAGFEKAYGSSGTMIALAEMCALRRPDRDPSYMTLRELSSLMRDLYPKTSEERRGVPGMSPSRADIIVAGGAIAEELMDLLGVDRIEISQGGLKQGMEMDYLLSSGHTDFDVKRSSVAALASRCQCDLAHAETVKANSMRLFDEMKAAGLHRMGEAPRLLLQYAAALHDVGEFISYARHHMHSQLIIQSSSMAGFDDSELMAMALMARFHHKRFPDAKAKQLAGLGPRERDEVLKCAMILKVADILDRQHDGSVSIRGLSASGGAATLRLASEKDMSMEMWKLETIKEEFKGVFGADLAVERVT